MFRKNLGKGLKKSKNVRYVTTFFNEDGSEEIPHVGFNRNPKVFLLQSSSRVGIRGVKSANT